MALAMTSRPKRALADQDPDYDDIIDNQVKRRRGEEKDAKDATVYRIETIIQSQFAQELRNKESEAEEIDRRLQQARVMLDRLRACIVASYYSKAGTSAPSKSEPALPSIHPAAKKHLGKTIKSSHLIGQSELGQGQMSHDVKVEGGLIDQTAEKNISTKKEKAQVEESPAIPAVSLTRGERFKIKKRIVVGNVSKYIPFDKRDENDHATHKWMVYVRGSKEEPHIDGYVKHIRFFLHPSYRPNDLVEVSQPPFHLTRRGWGEFPIRVQLHFRDQRNKSVDIIHQLKLDRTYTGLQTLGAETVVEVDLERDDTLLSVSRPVTMTTTLSTLVTDTVTNHAQMQGKIKEENITEPCSRKNNPVLKKLGFKPSSGEMKSPEKRNGLVSKGFAESNNTTTGENAPQLVGSLELKQLGVSNLSTQGSSSAVSPLVNTKNSPVRKTDRDLLKIDQSDRRESLVLTESLLESLGNNTSTALTVTAPTTTQMSNSNNSNQNHMTKLPDTKQTPVKVKVPGTTDTKVAAPGGGNVYVRCIDAQGKVYLIPQHLLMKNAPGGILGPQGAVLPQKKAIQLNTGSEMAAGGRQSPKGQGRLVTLEQGQSAQPIVFLQNSAADQAATVPVLTHTAAQLGQSLLGQGPSGSKMSPSAAAGHSATSLLGKSFTISGTRIGGLNNMSAVPGNNQTVSNTVTSILRSPQKVGQGQQVQVGIQVQGQIVNTGQGQVSILKPGTILQGVIRGTPSPTSSPGRAVVIQGGIPQAQMSGKITPVPASPKRPSSAQGVYIKSEPVSPRGGGTPVNIVSLPAAGSPGKLHSSTTVNLLGRAGTPLNTPGSIIPGRGGSPAGGISVTIKQEPGALSSAQLGISSAPSGSKLSSNPQTEPVQFVDPGVAPQGLGGAQKVQHLVLTRGMKSSEIAQNTTTATMTNSEPHGSDLGIPTQTLTIGSPVVKRSTGQVGQWTVVKRPAMVEETSANGTKKQQTQENTTVEDIKSVTIPPASATTVSTPTVAQNIVTMIGGQPYLMLNHQGGATNTSGSNTPLILVPAALGNKVQHINSTSTAAVSAKQSNMKAAHNTTYVVGSTNQTHALNSKSITYKNTSAKSDDSRRLENTETEKVISLPDMEDMECLVKTLVKQHPLVETFAGPSGEQTGTSSIVRHLHPYCAKTKEDFFKWNIGKRRAAEWQRACWVRRKIRTLLTWKEEFKGEKIWSTKQIMLWCRYHCYTPLCQGSRQFIPPSLYHSMQKFNSCTNSKDMGSRIDSILSKQSTQEEEDIFIDIVKDDDETKDEPQTKKESPVKKEPLPHSLPSSLASEFIHETAKELGICYHPVEVGHDTQANVLEEMILSATKSLADDIIRGAFSLASQNRGFPEELTPIDIYRSILGQKKCDFLTKSHLGLDVNEALGVSKAESGSR